MGYSGQTRDYKSRGPELLSDLRAKVLDTLTQAGLDADKAAEVSDKIVDRMRGEWGGELIYFPKGSQLTVSKRDSEIYRQFNGENHAILAKKFGLSVPVVYGIIKKMRELDMAERQNSLFPA